MPPYKKILKTHLIMKSFFVFLTCISFFQVLLAQEQVPVGVPVGVRQRTHATYYGDQYEGRKTASGEIFHNDSLTCSHRVFPFNTLLEISNPKTGLKLILRVNDRGPYPLSTIIYVTKLAAVKLGLNRGEKTPVEILVVGLNNRIIPAQERSISYEEDVIRYQKWLNSIRDGVPEDNNNPTLATPTPTNNPVNLVEKDVNTNVKLTRTYDMEGNAVSLKGYGVQLHSVNSMATAQELTQQLLADKLNVPVYIQQGWVNGKKMYRVIAGDLSRSDAQSLAQQLKDKGKKGFVQQHIP
jgi:rare lipoprotein A